MAKDGFLKYERQDNDELPVIERIKNFNEFHKPLDTEKRRIQANRCMNCGIPYCGYGKNIEGATVGCPLHNACPEFNDALYRGHYRLAYERLVKTNPFPEFTSRVCPALCEKACVEGLNYESVTTRDNEYEIIEAAFMNGWVKPQKDIKRNGKRIAIIGSGPAGLSCANALNHMGFEVTVYEKHDRVGGLLMYGIPNMKLEKNVVQRRIDILAEEGIIFRLNNEIRDERQAEEIMNSYDSVVLACGFEVPRRLNVEGEEAENVFYAVDFLSSTTGNLLDDKPFDIDARDKNVVIVGGGDTGNDVAGTCIRMGCRSLMQLEMMDEPPLDRTSDNPWPLWPKIKKTDYGQEEAIALFGHDPRVYNTTVNRILVRDGKINKVITVRVYKDETGRIIKDENSYQEIDCDMLFIAAGFVDFNDEIKKAFNLESVKGKAKSNDGMIRDRLFVCGDMANGQSLVVKAMADGLKVAEKVMKYLG